jgi:hypothetical protein
MTREQGMKVANGILHFLSMLASLAMAVVAIVEALA